MATSFTLPEAFKIVDGTTGPVTSNGGATTDAISMKNAHRVWILINAKQDVGNATTFQPQWASAVAPTGAANITCACQWWLCTDVATSDALVRQTAATVVTLDVGATDQLAIMEIDPSLIVATAGDTFDCLQVVVSDSTQVTNFVQVTFFIDERYPQAIPPSAIID